MTHSTPIIYSTEQGQSGLPSTKISEGKAAARRCGSAPTMRKSSASPAAVLYTDACAQHNSERGLSGVKALRYITTGLSKSLKHWTLQTPSTYSILATKPLHATELCSRAGHTIVQMQPARA